MYRNSKRIFFLFFVLASCKTAEQTTADPSEVGAKTGNPREPYALYFPIREIITTGSAKSSQSTQYICRLGCRDDFKKANSDATLKDICGSSLGALSYKDFYESASRLKLADAGKTFLALVEGDKDRAQPEVGSADYNAMISLIRGTEDVFLSKGNRELATRVCQVASFAEIFHTDSSGATPALSIFKLPENPTARLTKVKDYTYEEWSWRNFGFVPKLKGTLYKDEATDKHYWRYGSSGKIVPAGVAPAVNGAFYGDTVYVNGTRVAGSVGSCFPAGTGIATPSGDKSIENLKIGDQLTSYELSTGAYTTSTITDIKVHRMLRGMRVKLSNGKSFRPTPAHPIYSPSRSAWVLASDLRDGDTVMYRDEAAVTVSIEAISELTTDEDVYNLSVEPNHNYFADGVLVHNY